MSITKKYRSIQYGFEIEVPRDCYCLNDSFLSKLFRNMGDELTFKFSDFHFFLIKVIPFPQASNMSNMKKLFGDYAKQSGHKNVDLSNIEVDNTEHICACYLMGSKVSLTNKVGVEITKNVMRAYRRELGGMNREFFLEDSYRHNMGPVVKEYWLTFAGNKYIIIGALGFGTIEEVKSELFDKEVVYDQIVSSFKLVSTIS